MHNDKEYVIRLSGFDLGQLIDGLEARHQAWRDTAIYLRTGEMPSADFVMEECRDAEEAERLAAHYERIVARIIAQQNEQNRV
ncbi:MAG: hypothetical protein MUE88_01335 [Flavobacteriales bacterium]|jgi:hypothetical protein|nr:hypothetical protein [Flavobacteriales bacterium]